MIIIRSIIILILTLGIWIHSLPAKATNLINQPPEELLIHLGNTNNELKFFPNQLELTAGKRYKLTLDNPSAMKHYFTAKDFADISWTQKVETGSVELKGNIHEIELKPTGSAQWFLIPIKPGTYSLRCSIPGHTEAGMTGIIKVVS